MLIQKRFLISKQSNLHTFNTEDQQKDFSVADP